MRIEQSYVQKSKATLHAAQTLFIFIGGCLALAVLTKDGGTSGATGFFFGLCFLTLPAIIYQVMVPMWTRAWRFANVYAYATLDLLFAILWFGAFIAVSVWNSAGIRQGEKDQTASDGSCTDFAYGSEQKCKVSKASVGFGVIIFLHFVLTSAISIYQVMKYRKTGAMPGRSAPTKPPQVEDPGKDAWSTNLDEDHLDMQEDERQRYGQVATEDDEEGLLHQAASHDSHTEEGRHPGRPLSYQSSESPQTGLHAAEVYDDTNVPSALSPTGYQQTPHPFQPPPPEYVDRSDGRVSFPNGTYN